MAGPRKSPRKRGSKEAPREHNRDGDPSHDIEEHQKEGQSSTQLIQYQRQGRKESAIHGKRPLDIDSNANTSTGRDEIGEEETVLEQLPKAKRQKIGTTEDKRNRGSPARLFKLNKELVPAQKGVIIQREFGGLLDLAASSMPGDLSQWLMKHYDPEMSQIVIPDRGKIPVDAASVRRIWGLPNKGRMVCYKNCPEITKEMYRIYNYEGKLAPSLTTWCKMIVDMGGAYDDDFTRAWLAVAFSCFLAPSTSLSISPKSFPAVMDVNGIHDTNICQFVVDQLKASFKMALGKKNAVCCCVFHLVLLYLDSLDVDEPIPSLVPRVSVWNSDLIAKVVKKDRKAPGVYGVLRLKTEFSRCADDSIFGSMDHIQKFVAARLPESYDKTRQVNLTAMVHELCSEMSHLVGKFVHGIGRIDEQEADARATEPAGTGTSKQRSRKRRKQSPPVSDSLPSDEDSFKSDGDDSDEDDTESEESDHGRDDVDSDSDDDSNDGGGDETERAHIGGNVNEEETIGDIGGGSRDGNDSSEGRSTDKGLEVENVGKEAKTKATKVVESEEAKEDEEEDKEIEDDKEKEEEEDEEEEGEEEEEEGDEDKGDDNEGGNNDGGADGRDNEDNSGGPNSGCGDGKDGPSDADADNADSDDDENMPLQYIIQKKKDNRPKGLDEASPIDMTDLVMMEQKKESPLPEIPMFEVKVCFDDEPPLAFIAKKIFKDLISAFELKQLPTDFKELCPKATRIRLMQELCGLHIPVDKKKVRRSRLQLPPLPPKKPKNVSFIMEPTVVTATIEELQEIRASNTNQEQGAIKRQSALKKTGQVVQHQEAITSKEQASSDGDKFQLITDTATVKTAAVDSPVVLLQKSEEVALKFQASVAQSQASQQNNQASHSKTEASQGVLYTTASQHGQVDEELHAHGNIQKQSCTMDHNKTKHASFENDKCHLDPGKVAIKPAAVVSSGPVLKQSEGVHSKGQASNTESQATHPNKHATCIKVEATAAISRESLSEVLLAKIKHTQPSANTANQNNARQPLAVLNGQEETCLRGNLTQSTISKQCGKTQYVKLSQQSAGQENCLPGKAATINREASQEAKLLISQGKLPVNLTTVAQDDSAHVEHFNVIDKENHPPTQFYRNTSNSLEVNVLDINELLERCIPPTNKDVQNNFLAPKKDAPFFKGTRSDTSKFLMEEYCPAPSFDLGLDLSPTTVAVELEKGPQSLGFEAHVVNEALGAWSCIEIEDDDDAWDIEAINQVCAQAEQEARERPAGFARAEADQYAYNTPEKICKQEEMGSSSKFYSSSSSGEPVLHKHERRIIKPSACKRSPFMDLDNKRVFRCNVESNRLYASVVLHGRLNEEESPDVDTSSKVIDYNGYYVTVRELANSMRKEGFLLSHVVEIGIQSLMMNMPPDSKKVLMPLRFSTRLQQFGSWNTKEIESKFNKSNRLDRKDMIMFTVLENIDPTKPVTGNHYWVFNVNLRDKKFEVLDSWRTLQDISLDKCARTLVANFRSLWDHHYPKSHVVLDNFGLVNIDVPQQTNEFDCGVYALTIANGWEGRNVPVFTSDDIPNIRKQLTNTWVNTVHNKAPWKDILKLT